MGSATLVTDNLFYPFHSVEEWIVPIPAGQILHTLDNTFRMFFLLEGEFFLELKGHPALHVKSGDAYALSFPTKHILRSPHNNREIRLHLLRVQFQWQTCQALPNRKSTGHREKQFVTKLRQKLSGFQHFPSSLFKESHSLVRNILFEMEKQKESSAWKISGLCQALTSEVLEDLPSDIPAGKFHRRDRQKSTIVKRAQQYLHENCHEALTLDSVAWKMQLSGGYLSRLFKQETGQTMFEWIAYYRTEKARDLLIMTDLSLTQISRACGYSTPKLFIRHFKKNTGLSPIAYRQKIQNGEIFVPSRIIPVPNKSY